ncbi:MAG TPA: PEP-CTERM sorting domain-containing protein [Chthoniobacteraceae bacterium]|nr:PEP-CTERM sorting domain-containing protein [Chthoniobacteraceae bacterium]
MKPSLLTLLFTPLLTGIFCSPLQAIDYTGETTSSSNTWQGMPWQFTDPEQTGTPGIPKEGDSITRLYNNLAGNSWLYLDGNRSVDNLRIHSTTGIRIQNRYTAPGSNIYGDNTLSVAGTFQVGNSSVYLRGQHLDTSTRFTLETAHLVIGTEGESALGATNLLVSGKISETVDYSRATVNVTGTTTFYDRSSFGVEGTPTADLSISLGHVIFANLYDVVGNQAHRINLGTPATAFDYRVSMASLNSHAARSTRVEITGAATLVLHGNADDPAYLPDEGVHRFYGAVLDGSAIDKTGSNVQALSRATGNTYTGGTIIRNGALLVENSSGSGVGTGAVSIEAGGTLGGGGRIELGSGQSVHVKSGGTIAPGIAVDGVRKLTLVTPGGTGSPTLVMDEGSTFTFTLGAGHTSDQIEFLNFRTGDLSLASGGIGINIAGTLQEGSYELFSFRSGDESSARIASGLDDVFFLNDASGQFNVTFHYDDAAFGGTGVIAMNVAAIPEPDTALLLLGAGGIALLALRRRSA